MKTKSSKPLERFPGIPTTNVYDPSVKKFQKVPILKNISNRSIMI